MIPILAIIGFFAITIACALYFPRTTVLASSFYFYIENLGLKKMIEAMPSGKEGMVIIVLAVLVSLTISAFMVDLRKIQANPFK